MILGIGVDAANISRFSNPKEGLLKRILSLSELDDYSSLKDCREEVKASFLASRFAAKEAYSKARGTGFCDSVRPNEISVKKEKSGKPYIVLEGTTLKEAPKAKINLSLTHEEPLAIAFIVLEGECDGQI